MLLFHRLRFGDWFQNRRFPLGDRVTQWNLSPWVSVALLTAWSMLSLVMPSGRVPSVSSTTCQLRQVNSEWKNAFFCFSLLSRFINVLLLLLLPAPAASAAAYDRFSVSLVGFRALGLFVVLASFWPCCCCCCSSCLLLFLLLLVFVAPILRVFRVRMVIPMLVTVD